MNYLILIPFMAVLHRIRGGGIVKTPWKATYYIWLLIPPMLYWRGMPWQIALTWGLGYLVWIIPGWMRWASLGHTTPAYNEGRPLSWDEKIIEFLTPGVSQFWKLWFRGVFWLIPLYVALIGQHAEWIWLGIVWAVFEGAYAAAWEVTKDGDVAKIAEPVIGAAWGLAMALSI